MKYYLLIIFFPLSSFQPQQFFCARKLQIETKEPTIVWDQNTSKRISPEGKSCFYPRMIQLKDRSLLCTYSSGGDIVIQKSTDHGENWSKPFTVAEKRDRINMDTPELLQLSNGDLLLSYATRPQDALRGSPQPGKHFEIRIQRSSDNGLTWEGEKILYAAGNSFKDGCWEPAALQLPGGEIQLFFANEGIYRNSDEQNISMMRSRDNGLTWSGSQIISFRKGGRDGMPVPVWLPHENKIAVAIEDPGNKNFKPYIIRSAANGKWKAVIDGRHADRHYALAEKLDDSIYAGAPYLRRLSTGETILSYQSTKGRKKNKDNNSVMTVSLGDKSAKNFHQSSVPFPVEEGYGALWNSLCVIKMDTIIAVTSTNGFSKSASEIWMIKGYMQNGVRRK